jgi:hypothetical protein
MYSADHIKYESYLTVLTVQTFQLQMKWKCGKCFDHGERFFFIIFYLNTLHLCAHGSFTKKQQFYVYNNVSACFLCHHIHVGVTNKMSAYALDIRSSILGWRKNFSFSSHLYSL